MRRNHSIIRLFGCHFCYEAFCTVEALKAHCCPGFAQFLMNSLTTNDEIKIRFVTQSLFCAECNLQLPVSPHCPTDSLQQKLRNLLLFHNCQSLFSCLVYFSSKPVVLEHVKFRFVSSFNIPLCCSRCLYHYTSISDMEIHEIQLHSSVAKTKNCPVCAKTFVSRILFREHIIGHFGEYSSLVPFVETFLNGVTQCGPDKGSALKKKHTEFLQKCS